MTDTRDTDNNLLRLTLLLFWLENVTGPYLACHKQQPSPAAGILQLKNNSRTKDEGSSVIPQ